LLPVNL